MRPDHRVHGIIESNGDWVPNGEHLSFNRVLQLINTSHTGLRKNALACSSPNCVRLNRVRGTGEKLLPVGVSWALRHTYIDIRKEQLPSRHLVKSN
jgi:hypothetical protein